MKIEHNFLSKNELSYWMEFVGHDDRWNPPIQNHSLTQTLKEFRSDDQELDNKYRLLVDKIGGFVEGHYEEEFVVSNGPSFRKYTVGSFIGIHYDYSGDHLGKGLQLNRERHGSEHLPSHPIGLHDIQTVVYLNDDFLGGEFFLDNGISIKPKAGSLIMFPSTHAYGHGVSEVTSGKRYISAHFWIRAKTMALAVKANLLSDTWRDCFWGTEKVDRMLGL